MSEQSENNIIIIYNEKEKKVPKPSTYRELLQNFREIFDERSSEKINFYISNNSKEEEIKEEQQSFKEVLEKLSSSSDYKIIAKKAKNSTNEINEDSKQELVESITFSNNNNNLSNSDNDRLNINTENDDDDQEQNKLESIVNKVTTIKKNNKNKDLETKIEEILKSLDQYKKDYMETKDRNRVIIDQMRVIKGENEQLKNKIKSSEGQDLEIKNLKKENKELGTQLLGQKAKLTKLEGVEMLKENLEKSKKELEEKMALIQEEKKKNRRKNERNGK